MNLVIKIIIGFLAVIGALTLALAAYLYFADPLGLRELFASPPTPASTSEQPESSTDLYNLSPAQKLFLKKAGINPETLPSTISTELETCLTNAVGEERAAEIKAGAAPTITDYLKAKTCLN